MPYRTTHKKLYNIIACVTVFMILIMCTTKKSSDCVSSDKAGIRLPVLMYHGFTNGGKTSEYVIDVSDFEKDVLYLKENNFEFIDTYDLINYVCRGIPLPQKPVMITFDDGYLNNYTYAFPVLKKHNIKAVISPIAYYVEYYTNSGEHDPLYTQLTETEIKEMAQSGLVDFQNHSYNMHSLTDREGSSIKAGEKSKDYIKEFYNDLKSAEDILYAYTNKRPHAYVYPFGKYSKESFSVLKCCGYKITMSCEEGINFIDSKNESLHMLKRFNRTPEKSAKKILKG